MTTTKEREEKRRFDNAVLVGRAMGAIKVALRDVVTANVGTHTADTLETALRVLEEVR